MRDRRAVDEGVAIRIGSRLETFGRPSRATAPYRRTGLGLVRDDTRKRRCPPGRLLERRDLGCAVAHHWMRPAMRRAVAANGRNVHPSSARAR